MHQRFIRLKIYFFNCQERGHRRIPPAGQIPVIISFLPLHSQKPRHSLHRIKLLVVWGSFLSRSFTVQPGNERKGMSIDTAAHTL